MPMGRASLHSGRLSGMDVVVEIQSGEAEAQRLLDPILIERVVRR